MTGKATQNMQVLTYMEQHDSISALEAMVELNIMRLASRIHDLKKLGYEIDGEMVISAGGKRYKRYRIAS